VPGQCRARLVPRQASAGAAAVAGWAVDAFGAHGGFAVAAMATGVMAVLAVTGLEP
jgi:hypothetical protein